MTINHYPDGMRECTECHVLKPLDEFYNSKNGGARDGKMAKCKPCQAAITKVRNRKYIDDDPARYALRKQVQRLKNMGLTLEQFDAKLEQQNGVCAICGTATFIADHSRLTIDHDHACCNGKYSCGKCVRGLLCGSCNHGLGAFKDDPERVRAALDYLLSYMDNA